MLGDVYEATVARALTSKKEQEMQIVVWVLAICILLGLAAVFASVIDRRAGWNRIPLELDSSKDADERDAQAIPRS